MQVKDEIFMLTQNFPISTQIGPLCCRICTFASAIAYCRFECLRDNFHDYPPDLGLKFIDCQRLFL